jgi:hypothetical protein
MTKMKLRNSQLNIMQNIECHTLIKLINKKVKKSLKKTARGRGKTKNNSQIELQAVHSVKATLL